MRLTRWLVGAMAGFGLALMVAPVERAQALTPASPGSASAVKGAAGAPATDVRFGHGGGSGHGGFGRFHGGGFHHVRGGFRHHVFVGQRFHHRRFYAYNPYPYYYAPVYRCPVVWTVYGPRRICGYHRHYVRYWGRHHFHRYHYVYRFRHHRWM